MFQKFVRVYKHGSNIKTQSFYDKPISIGEDVIIANKLEATGLAGHIHISDRTLRHLGDEYIILPGPPEAKQNAYLRKYDIITYLIAAINVPHDLIEADLNELASQHTFKIPEDQDEVIKKALQVEFATMPVGVLS